MATEKNTMENIPTDVKTPHQANEKKPAFNWQVFFSINKKIKRDFDWFKTTKYIYPITIVAIVAVLTWFMFFLYGNVYATMSQAAELSNLKARISEEQLNKDNFYAILSRLAGKWELAFWINNIPASSTPFAYGARPKINNPVEVNASSTPNSSTSPIIATTTPDGSTITP